MKTVLIVDDEENFLASLVDGLSAFSSEFEVVTANDGQQALDALGSRQVDLIVTDLKMPEVDGFQLLANLSASHPYLPVIVMTAYGTPALEEKLHEFNSFSYVEKPIDFQNLANLIQAGLNQTKKSRIQGITTFSFIQLLEMEQKTCALKVKSQGREGVLYFTNGELVDAIYEKLKGDKAAFEIVSWDDAEIEIINIFKKIRRRISLSSNNLLMEAARLKDEATKQNADKSSHESLEPTLQLNEAQKESGESKESRVKLKTKGVKLNMANVDEVLNNLMQLEGAMAAIVVDSKSGMQLGAVGGGVNLDVAAAGNSEVVKAKMKTMQNLGLKDNIEDILISLGSQYHLIRPLAKAPNLFIYLVLNRQHGNLAMARHKLADAEGDLQI